MIKNCLDQNRAYTSQYYTFDISYCSILNSCSILFAKIKPVLCLASSSLNYVIMSYHFKFITIYYCHGICIVTHDNVFGKLFSDDDGLNIFHSLSHCPPLLSYYVLTSPAKLCRTRYISCGVVSITLLLYSID